MAIRPAWTVKDGKVISKVFEFEWSGGFAITQKQKNIRGLHEAIGNSTGQRSLEVSSKSTLELGNTLSAFHLTLSGRQLENVFQASKKYELGGPYTDLLEVAPKNAKRDDRHHTSGKLTAFMLNDDTWPLEPKTAFYDYLYVTAVYEAFGAGLDLSPYQWFTDIEFNPKKSINCQARSAAIYQLLQRINGFEALTGKDKWMEFHRMCVSG